jgi:glycosyltransferase involved in cell wall biosynthesis
VRSLVVVPTYQEAANVGRFLAAVRGAAPGVDILVADDNSPDGTGELAEKAAAALGHVEVLHRPGKEGLGSAYRDGFRAYTAETFERIHIDTTRANGYAFQSEVAFRMADAGLRLEEIPITFVDREFGTSKMSVRIMAESMARVTTWGIKHRIRAWRIRRSQRR